MGTIDIIGAVIGLAYIVSEYRADRWFWPLSLLMSVFYIVIDFSSGLFANGAICCYNFVMSIYGILVWHGIMGKKDRAERPISSCPRRYWPWIVAVAVVLSVALSWLLVAMNGWLVGLADEEMRSSLQYPVLDGISSALTIVAMWMLAHKWWQQWIIWLIVEPLMIALFWLTGNYASAALYVVFEVFCILGIFRWKKLGV
ncbi:MAG: nicotinamide mononucleotide transporter [Bacteroidales bacterium]|nr:nicotinamide mononucleotide transporter [Bacteroidales bacterium]